MTGWISRRTFLLAATAVLLLSISSSSFGQHGLTNAIKSQDKHNKQLFQTGGVVATGVSADVNNNAVIKIFTDRPVPGLPKVLDGVKVVVEQTDPFVSFDRIRPGDPARKDDPVVAQPGNGNGNGNGGGGGGGGGVSPQDRFDRPVPIGVSLGSTGSMYCFAGTLGCRLKGSDGNLYILSNNHVLAEENEGSAGADEALQPGTLDNDCFLDDGDTIGVLFDFVEIKFGNNQPNYVDAAIALAYEGSTGVSTPAGEAYGTPTSTTMNAQIEQRVVKYGRTTGFTYGKVDSINVSVNVGYDSGTALFVNQIVIRGTRPNGRGSSTFSAGGDSGSLIVDLDTNNPVGLLFAGNNSFTVANPIQTVLDSLAPGVTLTVDDGN